MLTRDRFYPNLVEAAPDLLAALDAALDEVDANQAQGIEPPEWAAQARSAIAKAWGDGDASNL